VKALSRVGVVPSTSSDSQGAKIELVNVTKTFSSPARPAVLALANTSFSVREKEFVSILGPSGCGKSTLLNMIAGFLQPSSGAIYYQGVPITQPSAARTMVFQNYALFRWMTVRENIAFGLVAKGMPKIERDLRVNELLQMVGLSEFSASYPHHLSGGMQQRVALARALAPDPDLVLLDEPFGALDLLTREVMQEEMLKLQEKSGKTFILITHSVEEAVFLGTRVLLMFARPGRIKEDIPIVLPVPRVASMRTESRAFLDYREYLSNQLRSEISR
jgi:NitT/TauT family transport system ATP-binding protein